MNGLLIMLLLRRLITVGADFASSLAWQANSVVFAPGPLISQLLAAEIYPQRNRKKRYDIFPYSEPIFSQTG